LSSALLLCCLFALNQVRQTAEKCFFVKRIFVFLPVEIVPESTRKQSIRKFSDESHPLRHSPSFLVCPILVPVRNHIKCRCRIDISGQYKKCHFVMCQKVTFQKCQFVTIQHSTILRQFLDIVDCVPFNLRW